MIKESLEPLVWSDDFLYDAQRTFGGVGERSRCGVCVCEGSLQVLRLPPTDQFRDTAKNKEKSMEKSAFHATKSQPLQTFRGEFRRCVVRNRSHDAEVEPRAKLTESKCF